MGSNREVQEFSSFTWRVGSEGVGGEKMKKKKQREKASKTAGVARGP